MFLNTDNVYKDEYFTDTVLRNEYIFRSKRLGFRTWQAVDAWPLHLINTDIKVMEHFPALPSMKETEEFIRRMTSEFEVRQYCYFAVDRLDTKEFIGFIGLSYKTFESEFTPCTDIGWRLAYKHWGNGFASEGASECLRYAFETLNLSQVMSLCPEVNRRSESVMQRIGMKRLYSFDHPLLEDCEHLKRCVLYGIENPGDLK